MSYISLFLRYRFESLPIDVKNAILSQNVALYTLDDLSRALRAAAPDPTILPGGGPIDTWSVKESDPFMKR
jgi:hypothetical protein